MALSPFSATWRNDIVRLFSKGIVSATDNAAIRSDGAGGIQSSPLIIADTTGAISRSGNGGIPVQGTNTNDSAAAGYVGELIESEILTANSVSVSNGTNTNVTSISLTAGDWDVWGTVAFNFTGVTATAVIGWVYDTSATLPTVPNKGAYTFLAVSGFNGAAGPTLPVGMRRYLLSATTTIYLQARTAFSAGTVSAYGYIGARRRR